MTWWQSAMLHPYSLYGLATALVQARKSSPEQWRQLSEDDLRNIIRQSLEMGLNHFRMRTFDAPQPGSKLRYHALDVEDLRREARYIQSSGLAAQGYYLYPTVVTTDGGAKGTWDNTEDLIEKLADQKKTLTSRYDFSRSFAPTTAKINQNGRASLSEPPGTLLEAACSAVATLTPNKPAAWVDQINTTIIPDLSLADMCRFIALFEDMALSNLDGDLDEARLPPKSEGSTAAPARPRRGKQATSAKVKSEYRRPRRHAGNYPYAPRNAAAFGPAGLLAAIGRWAEETRNSSRALPVLEALKTRPLYIISYDAITQAQFSHHVVGLAQRNKLDGILSALTRETLLYSEIDSGKPYYDSPEHKLLFLFASRFLQRFDPPAFRDFLAFRAEYAQALHSLFEEYFMNALIIKPEIIYGARVFGRWVNLAAYKGAEADHTKKEGETEQQRAEKIRKQKAKTLVTLDSMAMGARTSAAMLSTITRECGLLAQGDAPAEAQPFLDATLTGEIPPDVAQQLLMVYMRLRTEPSKQKPAAANTETEAQGIEGDGDGDSSTVSMDEGE